MLELKIGENSWQPPELDDGEIIQLIMDNTPSSEENQEKLLILRIRPYIDTIYVNYDHDGSERFGRMDRFVFHDDYVWTSRKERLFGELCLDNIGITYRYGHFDQIFEYYSGLHPEWNLRRYYTDSVRLLDHIYHCMRKNTVKELLYKSGLDMLAKYSTGIDDVNLLSSSPSEVYGGVSMKILRALNCETGAEMLCHEEYRNLFGVLGRSYGEIFSRPLNDAQCGYIRHLHERDLTPKEIGRLYLSRRSALSCLWHPRQFRDFLFKEKGAETLSVLVKIDPIYGRLLKTGEDNSKTSEIQYYLLRAREKYDRLVRVSNRKRNYDWQERDNGYVVRYPQTINDFCREAVYMSNCLLGYVDAFINNATTILFIRRPDDVNTPFITLEVYNGELTQAYHRFNMDCTTDEAGWIREYCMRHGIGFGQFSFNRELDLLVL